MRTREVVKYNLQYIPFFASDSQKSEWNLSADNNTTFALFERQGEEDQQQYFVNKTNATLQSRESSFQVRTPEIDGTANYRYLRILSVRLSVHRELQNVLNFLKVRVASNANKDFILQKDSSEEEQVYTLAVDADTKLDIDLTQNIGNLFSYFLDTNEWEKNVGSFTQQKLQQNVSRSVLFQVEVKGWRHNNELASDNRNILHSYLSEIDSHRISVFEYLKKISIFKHKFDFRTYSENVNIASVSIKDITVSYVGRPDKKIKQRKYDLGEGSLLDVKVRSYYYQDILTIQYLKVIGGVFTHYKVLDQPEEVFQTFYFIIHPDDVHLLPNPEDNRIFVIDGPRTDSKVYNSNPLKYSSTFTD